MRWRDLFNGVRLLFFNFRKKAKGYSHKKSNNYTEFSIEALMEKQNSQEFKLKKKIGDLRNKAESINDRVEKESILLKCESMAQNDPIELHFTYSGLIELYYGQREEWENSLEKCIQYCKKDISLFPSFKKEWINDEIFRLKCLLSMYEKGSEEYKKREKELNNYEWRPPRIPSFQRLAIIYEKLGKYEDAINVCNIAISYGLHDGTKGGFEGRIERLKKKILKN
ncbi:hypothetical protein NSR00_17935 [Aeribacillus sp. FSL K6-8394]|uniref:hypothetical protein n=1 Tax=Aeribacillus sp. FSL K6-8394 TaxID=2954570 RepID=UPI0030F96FEA